MNKCILSPATSREIKTNSTEKNIKIDKKPWNIKINKTWDYEAVCKGLQSWK